MIEDAFPRQQFPDVYDAPLLRIQEARSCPYSRIADFVKKKYEGRRISIYKGASVWLTAI